MPDKHTKVLAAQVMAVNCIRNHLNELSGRFIRECPLFFLVFELHFYTVGAAKEYAPRRKQFKQSTLAWMSLNTGIAKWKNGQVRLNGICYNVGDCYNVGESDGLSQSDFNAAVRVLDGIPFTDPHYRPLELPLATAQRARKKQRIKAVHAQIKNRRRVDRHPPSPKLVNENAVIGVGNVASTRRVNIGMANSWLEYQGVNAGVVLKVVDESYTTVTCSVCKKRTGPKGQEGLRIREWTCGECGITRSGDVNAARNVLALGHERLVGEISDL